MMIQACHMDIATHFFRTAVTDARSRALSSVWQFSSVKNELYVGVRGLAHQFKSSLHSSGKARDAFVSQTVSDRFQSPGQDRAISKWTRDKDSSAPQLLYQVVIPDGALATNLTDSVDDEVMRLASPPANHVLILSLVVFCGEDRNLLQPNSRILHRWTLPNQQHVAVTEHAQPIDPNVLKQMGELIRANTFGLEDECGQDFEHRMVFPMQPQGGVGQSWDIHIRQLDVWLKFAPSL